VVEGFELGTDGPSVVVVGVDGSPTSMHAAAYAAGLARRSNARLVAVHVPQTPMAAGLGSVVGADHALADAVSALADDVRDQVVEGAARLGLDVEVVVRAGDPYAQISAAADDARADVVVVGASARAGHRLVGSIAVKLVRSGRWPVTVVP
jgi:nucleotide-binding universal stress UspA family protein